MPPVPPKKKDALGRCPACGRIARKLRPVVTQCSHCNTVTVTGAGTLSSVTVG